MATVKVSSSSAVIDATEGKAPALKEVAAIPEQVAAHGGHVPQLARRARQHRLAQRGIPAAHLGMGRRVAVGRRRADDQPAARRLTNTVKRQEPYVHQPSGCLDPVLHQVDEVRAAAEVAGAVVLGHQGERVAHLCRAPVGELLHPATSS
jgi:hypothetical protein